jgi:broad specificity phosphatase PhoE
MRCLFVTHPEVVVEPLKPVPQWRLSQRGASRATSFAASGALAGFEVLISSTETKARETAQIFGEALGLPIVSGAALCENDRSSTGFLPPDEFERTADAFFSCPTRSIRGWETALEAQTRVVGAVKEAVTAQQGRTIAFVAHGAVGALLLCSLLRRPISRDYDQPRQGCWYAFDASTWRASSAWREMPD